MGNCCGTAVVSVKHKIFLCCTKQQALFLIKVGKKSWKESGRGKSPFAGKAFSPCHGIVQRRGKSGQ